MIQSIKVIGKNELEITFAYEDEYKQALHLIEITENNGKVG